MVMISIEVLLVWYWYAMMVMNEMYLLRVIPFFLTFSLTHSLFFSFFFFFFSVRTRRRGQYGGAGLAIWLMV